MGSISKYVPNQASEASKLNFALKTAGIIPDVLPNGLIEGIRGEVASLVEDGGEGMLRISPEKVVFVRNAVRERLKELV